MPPGTKDVYLKRIQEIPEDKRTSWRFHVVRTGESLDSIAASTMAVPQRSPRPIDLDADAIDRRPATNSSSQSRLRSRRRIRCTTSRDRATRW